MVNERISTYRIKYEPYTRNFQIIVLGFSERHVPTKHVSTDRLLNSEVQCLIGTEIVEY